MAKGKTTDFSEYVERYLDCPYCGFLICDDEEGLDTLNEAKDLLEGIAD